LDSLLQLSMSNTNNLPELLNSNPWDKSFSNLIDFLNKFYTDDIREVATDLGLPNVGGKQDLLHRVVNNVLVDNQSLSRMFIFLANKPFVKRRTNVKTNKNPLEKIWRLHQMNEGLGNIQEGVSTGKKRMTPYATSKSGVNPIGPPHKRQIPPHDMSHSLPKCLPVIECTYCTKNEIDTSPVFWCPQCRTIQHKNCVFGSPIGLNFTEKCRSWDLLAAYLIFLNAESYDDLKVPNYVVRPWDYLLIMTLKKQYKNTPILHNWNRYHTHPNDTTFNNVIPVRRSPDLPLPENPPNKVLTKSGSNLQCTVAECLGCSLVFMQPFRAAAVSRSIPANPLLGQRINYPFAHNIEDCISTPVATSEVAKDLLKLLLDSLPAIRAIYKDQSNQWEGTGKETKEKEYLLGCRSSLLWEFRIPESRVRDGRPTITASISDASFTVPLRWKELRKMGYSCELRGINITEAVGREASYIRWPHELNMEINDSKVYVAPPEPNSTRRDTAIDISGYIHGGENHLNVKMQINTEPIGNGQTLRMNQAFKLGITLLKNKKLEEIILTIVRRNIMELSVQILLSLRRKGLAYNNNMLWTELRSIIRNLSYEWYDRLGEVTIVSMSDPEVWRSWLGLVNYNLPAKSTSNYQNDDVECLTNVNDLKINLIDCVSLSRLNVPMRGRFCRHSQPLDLLYYLQIVSMMTPRRNRYICPICQAEIQLIDIVIDWDLLFELATNQKVKEAEHLLVQLDHTKHTLTYEIESSLSSHYNNSNKNRNNSSVEESDESVVIPRKSNDENLIVKPDPEEINENARLDVDDNINRQQGPTSIDIIDLSDD